MDNNIIDTSCQKGSIQKMAGCWEHMSMVWEALKDARKRRKSLAVIWLDLANAYGSVPHQLIRFALQRYGVPEFWINFIFSYYGGLWGHSIAGKGMFRMAPVPERDISWLHTLSDFVSGCHEHCVGIRWGCWCTKI